MTWSNRIAVDIVLIPDSSFEREVVSFNQALDYEGDDQIELSPFRRPHITMRMGLIRPSDIPELKAKVSLLSDVKLTCERVLGLSRRGRITQYLEFEESDLLVEKHNTIMSWKGFVEEPCLSTYCADEPIDSRTTDYIENFRKMHAGSAFWPHMTLGRGESRRKLQGAHRFTWKIFQLGNHCTCVNEI